MGTLWQDIRYGGRMLAKSPGFTAIALITLAVGIGANLALFGVLNEMLLRPKPVARPHELWAIVAADENRQPVYANICRPYYDAIRREGRGFQGIIGYAGVLPKLRTDEAVERVSAELVSGEYFSFVGVAPVLGRGFLPEEEAQTGAHTVAVISHAFWQDRFGGTPDVLGKTVTLNNMLVQIVGVAPKGFGGLGFRPPSLWLPASMEPMLGELAVYDLVGRLAEPRQAAAAADLLTPVAAEVTKELSGFTDSRWSRYGVSPSFRRIRLDPIGRGLLGTHYLRPRILGVLQFAGVATMLLLLIACANVASLFLTRALQRRREMATRMALGATRAVLVRQLVCEGVLVAIGGTVGALLVFSWIGGAVVRFAGRWPGPLSFRSMPDVRVLLFAAAGALAVGVGFSLVPALQAAGFQPSAAIKEGGCAGPKRSRLRQELIIVQVAGSLVLLCGATLCLRSMSKQLAVDLGYRCERLAIAPLDLERIGVTEATVLPQLGEIIRRAALVPGVEQVCVSPIEPFCGLKTQLPLMELDGYDLPSNDPILVGFFPRIGPAMFAAMGIPLLRGREFTLEDVESDRKVVVVNESFVRKFWPDQEPLGKHIRQSEVVGVVKDACLDGFHERPDATVFGVATRATLLQPSLLIRAKGDAGRVVASVRGALERIHPNLARSGVCTLRDTMRNVLAAQDAAMRVLGVLGGVALLLASIGTYGVMAYVVNSRTREIGVRLAMGATRGDVMRLVLSTGLRLGLVAVAIGLPLALGVAGILRHQIAGVSPFDPISFAVVTGCVLAVLLVACYLPARRAAKVDPMAALRCE
jgi:predicted permease